MDGGGGGGLGRDGDDGDRGGAPRCPECGGPPAGPPGCATHATAAELAQVNYTLDFLDWATRRRLLDAGANARLQSALHGRRGHLTAPLQGDVQTAEPPLQAPTGGPASTAPLTGAPDPLERGGRVPPAGPVAPARPRGQSRSPAAPGRSRLRRAWAAVSSDIGLHGLAYLGVLLLFAGTLGLVVFAFGSVNPLVRPLAEVVVPLVLLGSAAFLRRRGAPLAAGSLELLGGAVLPIALFASLMDGSAFPPDLPAGAGLLVVLALGCLALAVLYALIASRRQTPLGYLVGPLVWTAAGVLGYGLAARPSAGQFALVAAAIAGTMLAARRLPRTLATRLAVAALPAAAVAVPLALLLAATQPRPVWPCLLTALAGMVIAEQLGDRFGRGRGAAVAQALVLGAGLAVAVPVLGVGAAGATAVGAFLLLDAWQAARLERAPALPLAGAVLGWAAASGWRGSPWSAVIAAALLTAWSQAQRDRLPVRAAGRWGAVAAVTVAAPFALAGGLLRALGLGSGPGVAVLGLLALAFGAVARHCGRDGPRSTAPRPGRGRMSGPVKMRKQVVHRATAGSGHPLDGRLDRLLAHGYAAVVLGCTVVALVAMPAAAAGGAPGQAWQALAAALATGAVMVTPGALGPRTVAAASAATWSAMLGLEAAGARVLGGGPARASLALALIALLHAALARAALARAARVGARADAAAPARPAAARPVATGLATVAVTVAGVAVLLAGLVATAPLPAIAALAVGVVVAALLARALPSAALAWWAWAQAAPLVVLAAVRLGVPGDRWQLVLAAWGASALLGALSLDQARAGRRRPPPGPASGLDLRTAGAWEALHGRSYVTGAPREWVLTGWLVPPAVLGAAALALGVAAAAPLPRALLGVACLAAAGCWLIAALQLRAGSVSAAAWLLALVGLTVLRPAGMTGRPAAAVAVPALLVAASWALERLAPAGARPATARRGVRSAWLRWDLPPFLLAHGVAAVWLLASVPLGWVPVVWPGLGLVAFAVALWRRGWAWAIAGDVLLAWAPAAHPGWGFGGYTGMAAWKAVAAGRARGAFRTLIQVGCVLAAAAAWADLVVWVGWQARTAVPATLLAAGTAGLILVMALRWGVAGRRPGLDWAAPAGLAVLGAAAAVLVWGGVPAGLPGVGAAAGVALLAVAAGVAVRPLRAAWLRPAAATLAAGASQLLLAAARPGAAVWAAACLALAILVTATAVGWWRRRPAAAWLPATSVAGVLTLAAGWAATSTVASALAAPSPPAVGPFPTGTLLVAAALTVAAVQAAALGTVHGVAWLRNLAPPLAGTAWVLLAPDLVGGDPLWRTIPLGGSLLVTVELARADRRRAGRVASPPDLARVSKVAGSWVFRQSLLIGGLESAPRTCVGW